MKIGKIILTVVLSVVVMLTLSACGTTNIGLPDKSKLRLENNEK